MLGPPALQKRDIAVRDRQDVPARDRAHGRSTAATVRRGLTRPIILIGLMGSGKTTIGQQLAARLGVPFKDSDKEIERAAACTVADLFARHGEPCFRDGERRVIARLLDAAPKVIATGGGAFMNASTRELILERGFSVWLNADLDVLARRVARKPGQRPLLLNRDARTVLAELAEVRNPIYAQSLVHVRSDAGGHEPVVDAIIEALASLIKSLDEPNA